MCSRSEPARAWVVGLALAALAAGCNQGSGGKLELCNHIDDDWDGVTDDPFIDDQGRYDTVDNCGDCGIPTADEVACSTASGKARCEITACADGFHLVGTSLCTADEGVLCMPCETDAQCAQADPNSLCVTLPGGDRRCGMVCDGSESSCPAGFACESFDGDLQCVPASGSCGCTPDEQGVTFGCWIEAPDGEQLCPGQQICESELLTPCEAIAVEVCNSTDDDCDGETDEDFLVDGQYLSVEHCGACYHPCVPPAPNMDAECLPSGDETVCEYDCLDGFVDLDLVQLNGCECEMTSLTWPPTAHGGDGNCDGELDDLSQFVYVSKNGDDANPGTLEEPVLTITRGIEIAEPGGKTVFVGQGGYDEQVVLAAGVSMFGGYRSDFGDRDTIIYETELEHTSGPVGHPVLMATGIDEATEVGGFTFVGSDALVPGAGSNTVLLDDCGPELAIGDVLVLAGEGADGLDGQSSAAILVDLGVPFPALLDGTAGINGGGGFDSDTYDCVDEWGQGGSGGDMVCPVSETDVGGGDGGDASCPESGCEVGDPCGNAGCTDFMVLDICDFDAVYAAAVPNPPAEDGHGPGGGDAGELTYDAVTNRPGSTFCDDNPTLRREGDDGQDGQDGADGVGGDGWDDPDGVFDQSTGIWISGNGTDGSGGGGGTQGNGYDRIPGASFAYTDHLGGAGGGGGSGGCGPPGAGGGDGGGGSIGVVILLGPGNDGPTLSGVRVTPAAAGKGGDGGVGLAGGAPGPGGLGGNGNFWCARVGGKGGDGGQGGDAGGGGGGGGGSISGFHVVAHSVGDPDPFHDDLVAGNEVDAMPSGGSGGSGGFSPSDPGTAGVNGTSVAFRLVEP
jgi:hypothetical protein